MNILIDTNILIKLEDYKIVDYDFSLFYRLAVSNNCRILYHPKAISIDLENDIDSERKTITKSKLQKYEPLINYSEPTNDFLSQLRNKSTNDEIDNLQLFQLYKNYVDYFVTEDRGVHANAKKIGLQEKVLKVKDIRILLEDIFTIVIPFHPILKEHSIRKIEDKFNSTFFDSLRIDYGEQEFNEWLKKCAQEDRKCYSLTVDDDIQALLIYNLERIEDHRLKDIYENALKICTLKVSNTAFGIKLGELFLHKMFEYCIEQKINYLYLTVFEKQTHLIKLLNGFGFIRNYFVNKRGFTEIQMIKCLDKSKINQVNKQNKRENHPFYFDDIGVKKYVIPIQPQYYITLFKDGKLRQPTLFDLTEESINEIQGNTIIKAYISNSQTRKVQKGDLLFFYASQTNKVIEPVGVLETIQIVDNFDDLWKIVRGKTVFSQTDLNLMLDKKGKLNVITFRLITYLNKKIILSKIQELSSFRNNIQTITNISESDYLKLKNEGYFDGRYIID